MPALSRIFKAANVITLLAWVALITSLFLDNYRAEIHLVLFSVVIFALSALYTYLMFFGRHLDQPGESPRGHFRSLNGVMSLFKSPRAVLAGWIHYLAFDLLAGILITQHALQQGISAFLLIPVLLLTLMLAPAGLTLYFILFLILEQQWLMAL